MVAAHPYDAANGNLPTATLIQHDEQFHRASRRRQMIEQTGERKAMKINPTHEADVLHIRSITGEMPHFNQFHGAIIATETKSNHNEIDN